MATGKHFGRKWLTCSCYKVPRRNKPAHFLLPNYAHSTKCAFSPSVNVVYRLSSDKQIPLDWMNLHTLWQPNIKHANEGRETARPNGLNLYTNTQKSTKFCSYTFHTYCDLVLELITKINLQIHWSLRLHLKSQSEMSVILLPRHTTALELPYQFWERFTAESSRLDTMWVSSKLAKGFFQQKIVLSNCVLNTNVKSILWIESNKFFDEVSLYFLCSKCEFQREKSGQDNIEPCLLYKLCFFPTFYLTKEWWFLHLIGLLLSSRGIEECSHVELNGKDYTH